ncbi:TatD-like deoxyribonuclease [Theileria orientalis strain Shintoku]|uniref:TatD-like deoxyribonuclease n=1 Tax=Theileria orientalis strain Shintoku TaxID=869250 RepID=J4CD33_THEOR|nr:TatD-like deoxyribonuclease [Theileria orientalis strain Shintoku]BAM40442.1 TatD-like deoxyribonuclease [Theileria orientalis strain Shintoku]|eukprot:XP_009690743.1 TatD-like deoxyribonuclease [Theileria orientalis strain Shintoku]
MRVNLALCLFIKSPIVYHPNLFPSRLQIRNKYTMETKNENIAGIGLKFVDIGANLTDKTYQGYYYGSQKHKPDLDKVFERAKKVGMEKIIITAGNLDEVNEALKICNTFDKECQFLYTTVGVHPTMCKAFLSNKYSKTDTEYLNTLDELIAQNRQRVVAIGELGLDYDRLKFCDKETQKKYFELQLELVEKHKIPMFLHLRNATSDFLEIMMRNKHKWVEAGGVVHSYTGDAETMEELVKENFYIGVNGCSLKTDDNLNTVKKIPLDKLLLETDCPWCGIRNSHSSSKYVKTKFNSVNKPNAMTAETTLSSRNEPCFIL